MLSRFLLNSAKQASTCLRVVSARTVSSSVSTTAKSDIKIVDMNYPARLMDWENFKMPGAPYEGMGPLPPVMDFDKSQFRHYFIPEYWFNFLYPRTGASGLYVLFGGLAAMLVSKEYYIFSHDTNYLIVFIVGYTVLNKYLGKFVQDYFFQNELDRIRAYEQIKAEELNELIKSVDEVKLNQWRAQGQGLINDARRSNLTMMLETEYLNRQATVVETVKRMLEYQVAVQKAETDLAQKHMVSWIEKKVEETITPETQKATLNACIAQLNSIAARK